VRWETKQSFDGQLHQEYSYQNLLKSDHFSSSYDQKKFFMPHSADHNKTAYNIITSDRVTEVIRYNAKSLTGAAPW